MTTMKALSVQQPWAWCIVNGYKPVENRSRNTKHRGPLAIHAGKGFDHAGWQWIKDNMPGIAWKMPLRPEAFERGGIVGLVIIDHVVQATDLRSLVTMISGAAVRWFFGPYGYVMTNARNIPFIPCRGMLGFFNVELPNDVIRF